MRGGLTNKKMNPNTQHKDRKDKVKESKLAPEAAWLASKVAYMSSANKLKSCRMSSNRLEVIQRQHYSQNEKITDRV